MMYANLLFNQKIKLTVPFCFLYLCPSEKASRQPDTLVPLKLKDAHLLYIM